MTNPIIVAIVFALSTGQLVKFPIGTHGGILLIDLVVLTLCFVGIIKSKLRLGPPPIFIKAALAFLAVALLSLVATPLKLNLNEYFTAASYSIRFASYFFLSWLIISGAFAELPKKLEFIILTSSICLSVLGLLQFVFLPNLELLSTYGWDPHYYRAVSTFFDPNFLGGFLVIPLVLLTQDKFTFKNLRWILFGIFYITLMLTFSRSSYLAFSVSFITLSVLNKSIRLFILTIVLCLILLLGFAIYHQNVAQPKGVDKQKSAESRLGSWQQGILLFEKHPTLGVGFNAYRYSLREYHLGSKEDIESHGGSSNDLSLLHVASTTGIIGLTSYLFLLFTLFHAAWNNYLVKNPWGIILLATLTGILSQGLFINNLFYPPILLLLVFMLSRVEAKISIKSYLKTKEI